MTAKRKTSRVAWALAAVPELVVLGRIGPLGPGMMNQYIIKSMLARQHRRSVSPSQPVVVIHRNAEEGTVPGSSPPTGRHLLAGAAPA